MSNYQNYQQLAKLSNSGLAILNLTGDLIWANQSFWKIVHQTPNKLNFFAFDRKISVDKHSSDFKKLINKIEHSNKPHTVTRTWLLNGQQIVVQITLQADKNQLYLDLKDISQEIKGNQRREHILKVVGHELKNPLASLMAMSETIAMLNQESDAKKRLEYVKKIKQKIILIDTLLADFLDVTRLSGGELIYNDQSQSLMKFLNKFVTEYRLSHQTHWLEISGSIKSKVVFDPQRLSQVLDNLLSNAIKNSESGTLIKISIKKLTSQNRVQISVKDQGVGIPQPEQHKIFDLYYQVKSRPSPSGMGIGLFLVREILNHYQSKIEIVSQKSKGTTISFSLPIANTNNDTKKAA